MHDAPGTARAPRRIAFLNPDSLGDIVLRQPLFAAVEAAGWGLVLVVRPTVVSLAERLAPDAIVIPLPVDPYDPVRPPAPFHVAQVVEELLALDIDTVVSAAYQRTWFDELVIAGLPTVRRIGFAGQRYPANTPPAQAPGWIEGLSQVVAVEEHEHDWRKNQRLAETLVGHSLVWNPPQLTATTDERDAATRLLAKHGLDWSTFHVACVGTSSRVQRRSWPEERWLAVLRHAHSRLGARFLLIGTPDEQEANRRIVSYLGPDIATCLDDVLDLEDLLGLIARSDGYVGRDSGPMHFAAALGKPVLSVTGGGTWPRFIPLAPAGFIFSLDVPCAGCGWFCHLDDAYCVTRLPLEPVLAAVDDHAARRRSDRRLAAAERPTLEPAVDVRLVPRPATLALHMERVAAREGRSRIWQLHQLATVGPAPPPALSCPVDHGHRPRVFLGMHFYGAGNIGDDLALAGFLAAWARLGSPADLVAAIPFPTASQARRFPAIEWLADDPLTRETAIRTCDAWLGLGGSPFQSDCGPWMLEHLARDLAACRRFRRPMYFVGAGLNDRASLDDPRARAALAQAEHLWIRDADCAAWTAAVAGTAKVTAAADCAHIFLAGLADSQPRRGRLGWAVAIEDDSEHTTRALEQAILRLADRRHDWLVQDGRCLPGGERWRHRRFGSAARRLLRLRVPDYDVATAADLLAAWPVTETLVSSRYHALLVGAWRRSRLVPVSRNDKLSAAARELGCPPPVRSDDGDALCAAVAAAQPVDRTRLADLADAAFVACRGFVERLRGHTTLRPSPGEPAWPAPPAEGCG